MVQPNDNSINNLKREGRREDVLTEFKEENNWVKDEDNPFLAETEVSIIETINNINDMQETHIVAIQNPNEIIKNHKEKCTPEIIEISDSNSDGDRSMDSNSDSSLEGEDIVITVTTSHKSRDKKIKKNERTTATIRIQKRVDGSVATTSRNNNTENTSGYQSSDSFHRDRIKSKKREMKKNQSQCASVNRKDYDKKGKIIQKKISLWLDALNNPVTFSSHPLTCGSMIEETNIPENLSLAERSEETKTMDLPCPEKTVGLVKTAFPDDTIESHNPIVKDSMSSISNIPTTSLSYFQSINDNKIEQNFSEPEFYTIDEEEGPICSDKSFSSNVTVLKPIKCDEQSNEYPVFGVVHVKNDKNFFTESQPCGGNVNFKFRDNIKFESKEIEDIILSDGDEEHNHCPERLFQKEFITENRESLNENSRDKREVKKEYKESRTPRHRDENYGKQSNDRNNNNESIIAAEEFVCEEINWNQSSRNISTLRRFFKRETSVDYRIREKMIAEEGNETHDEKSFNGKESREGKRQHNEADHERKLLAEKRARVGSKSHNGDRCNEEKRYRDKNRVVDEKQYGKDKKSQYDRRHFDEQHVSDDNRHSNDKRVDGNTDLKEKLRVDSNISRVEKGVRKEYEMHDKKKLRENNRSFEEKLSFKKKRSSIDEKRFDCDEKLNISAKSHKQDVKEHCLLQNNATISDNNKMLCNSEQISNDVCVSRDPRLKAFNARSQLLAKSNHPRQDVPIVEPPVLLKGERRAVSINIVKLNNLPAGKKPSADTQNPDKSPDKNNTRVSLLEKKPEQIVRRLTKKESARINNIQQKIYRRENEWRRQKHPWARGLPVSKKRSLIVSPEEKNYIKITRKERLKWIAERQKNPITDVSANSDTDMTVESAAIVVPNPEVNVTDETLAQREAAQGMTPLSGAYYLYCKPLEPTKRILNDRNEYIEWSDTDYQAVENSKSAATKFKNSASNGSVSVQISKNATEIRASKALWSGTEKDGLKSSAIQVKLINNLRESKPEDFLTLVIDKQSELNVTEPKAHPQLEDFLSHIFQWNPTWLEEEKECNSPPPVVDESRLTAMLSRYQSFEHYYNIVEPLLALEMWHAISDDYKLGKNNLKLFSIIPYSIESSDDFKRINVSTLELQIVVSEQDLRLETHPSHGDLLFFNYLSNRRDQHGSLRWTVFAYVTGLRKTVITPLTMFDRNLLTNVKDPHTVITITVMTKSLDPTDVQMHRVNELQKIMYIRSNIRMVQAVQQLHTSPLINMILHPKIEDYQLPSANNMREYRLFTKHLLNTKQLGAVMSVTEAVVQNVPKICLIQGPPGTGKSKVIVNLVMQILYGDHRYNSDKKLKILMCAPSNTAIDEIVLRLLEIQQSLEKENRFSLVRIGRTNTMHPKAKVVSAQELARKGLDLIVNEQSSVSFSGSAIQSHCERSERRKFPKRHRDAEHNLLKNADIIASTLTSCYTSQMELALGENEDANLVCIVDEATQCTEPESLIPLILGVKTLILVGDTNQLPATVLSQKAKHLGLDQSLFARIARVFEATPNNPIIQLDVQYRMTVPVALFPNKYFYGGMLKNAARMHKLPFHLYRVINLDSTQDNVRFSNSHEANFVANLIYTMIARTNYGNANLPVKVGIITPYKNQKILLMKKINNCIARLKDKDKIDFEVNTVDSYQGQERDVIIMSCVRSSGIGFLSDPHRLCVALTRAKHSLIMCGNFKTFQKDPMWNALLADAKSRGVYVNVKSDADPGDIRPYIIR